MRTHPLNVSYLVVGLIFLGLSGSWALRASGVIDLGEIQWLLPLTLVVAGAVGLVAAAAKGLRSNRTQDQPDDPDPYPDSSTDDYTVDYTSDIEEKLR